MAGHNRPRHDSFGIPASADRLTKKCSITARDRLARFSLINIRPLKKSKSLDLAA